MLVYSNNAWFVVFLGQIEENKFCRFSPDSNLGFFVTHHFSDRRYIYKKIPQITFFGIFKKVFFFRRAVKGYFIKMWMNLVLTFLSYTIYLKIIFLINNIIFFNSYSLKMWAYSLIISILKFLFNFLWNNHTSTLIENG